MDDSVVDAMDKFYKLKSSYEKDIADKKRAIRRDRTLTAIQKRQKMTQLRSKCLNCGKQGGIVFSVTADNLKAQCGNASEPCNLNIDINKGSYENVLTTLSFLKGDEETTKSDIIRTKLNLLFGYIGEDEALTEFHKLREKLKDDLLLRESVEADALKIITRSEFEKAISENKISMFVEKQRLKAFAEEFSDTNQQDKINDMIEVYNGELKPLAKQLMENTYAYTGVECFDGNPVPCEDGISYLIQAPFTYKDLAYQLTEDPVVIANQE